MTQVQVVITEGDVLRIECNLLEREDCTETERQVADFIEQMHIAAIGAMQVPHKTLELIRKTRGRNHDETQTCESAD
jgi:hypothetical protein